MNLNNFIPSKFYSYVIGAIILLVTSCLSYFSIEGYIAKKKLDKATAQVAELTNQINVLKGEKAAQAKAANDAVSNFLAQKARADKAELKLAQLKPVVLPSVSTDSSIQTAQQEPIEPIKVDQVQVPSVTPECMVAIKNVQTQYEVRETVYKEVIVEQKATIAEALTSVTKLQEEISTDNKIIATFDQKDKIKDDQLTEANKKAAAEESSKKVYRTTSIVLGTIVVILVL